MGLIFSNVPLFIYSDDVASFLAVRSSNFCVRRRELFMESLSAFQTLSPLYIIVARDTHVAVAN